jgi:hypothetical protein
MTMPTKRSLSTRLLTLLFVAAILALLIVLAIAVSDWNPLLAATPCGIAPPPPLCVGDACSNDSLTPPVVGDELVCWTPSVGVVTEYRVTLGPHICAVLQQRRSIRTGALIPPLTYWRPYASSEPGCWPALNWTAGYRVTACNCTTGTIPCGCSTPGPVTEFRGQPFACFRAGVGEVPCELGLPLVYNGRVRP